MKGDFTRNSFDPRKPYSRVMIQQGRVQLDADWNEQTALMLRHMRILARDLLGRGAGPIDNCGFKVVNADQPPAPTGGRLPGEPGTAPRGGRRVGKKGDLRLLAGCYYVEGLMVELQQDMFYSDQPGYPFDDETKFDNLAGTSWLAYLDVWEDFVSADQDEALGEPALGGVDTCGRAKVMWQVRILLNPNMETENPLAVLGERSSGEMKAWTKQSEAEAGPCIIAPDAIYRGRENQLYRVEIHQGTESGGGGATFKWSRDNGSIAFRVTEFSHKAVSLDRLGRDDRSTLSEGDWVELVDEAWAGHDPAGPLAQVREVLPDRSAVVLDWAGTAPPPPSATGLRPLLRRWDHKGDLEQEGGAIPVETSEGIELEDGIYIRFTPDRSYRAGDYWLIPARAATGDIIWDGPEFRPPDGPEHFYAPLAHRDAGGGDIADKRSCFRPIIQPPPV